MDWIEQSFFPVPYCNTFSMHHVNGAQGNGIMCVTVFGKVVWMDCELSVDLNDFIDEELDEGTTAELVASDCASHPDQDILAFLATCWVIYDEHYMPNRYFAAVFKISTDLSMTLGCKFVLENPPSFTRVTAVNPVAQYRHCWLIFTESRAVRLFTVEPMSVTVEEVDTVGDVYPGLDLGDLPGSAVRSCCVQTSKYRWSILGFDTGYVIITTVSLQTNFIIDRSKLKFSGVISVLQLIKLEGREDKILVLISSTVGPAAVWSLALSVDKSHFEWSRTTILEDTKGHDAVICSAFGDSLVGIGTYGKRIVLFRMDSIISGDARVYPCASIDHSSPIIGLHFLNDKHLVVLSTSGLHSLILTHTPSHVFTEMESRNCIAPN